MSSPPSSIPALQTLLETLLSNPDPTLPSPPNLKKRASIALIIRLSPSYTHPPPTKPDSPPSTLEELFSPPWTTHSTPEILFIKRSARPSDPWTSHIALPGGKRDPTDPSDLQTAIRETEEEIGINLEEDAVFCGGLPQRVITTRWGKEALMVLCPFVFILKGRGAGELRVRASEVASAHWVPLEELRGKERRTVVFEDVVGKKFEGGVLKKWVLRRVLGRMVFAGVVLEPMESVHSRISEEDGVLDCRYLPPSVPSWWERLVGSWWEFPGTFPPRREAPLILWGLTLGVICDFLELLPPPTTTTTTTATKDSGMEMWTFPTFTPPDVRFAIWLLTYRCKIRRRVELQSGAEIQNPHPGGGGGGVNLGALTQSARVTGIDTSTECLVPKTSEGKGDDKRDGRSLEGWVEWLAGKVLPECTDRSRYFELVRRAVVLVLIGRLGVGGFLGWVLWRGLKRRRIGGGVAVVSG